MRADVWDAWVERLLDPESKQAQNRLKDSGSGGMCCLGHLCDVVIEMKIFEDEDISLKWWGNREDVISILDGEGSNCDFETLPPIDLMRRLGVKPGNEEDAPDDGDVWLYHDDGRPVSIAEAFQAVEFSGYADSASHPRDHATLSKCNDAEMPLAQIAQLIQKFVPRDAAND